MAQSEFVATQTVVDGPSLVGPGWGGGAAAPHFR